MYRLTTWSPNSHLHEFLWFWRANMPKTLHPCTKSRGYIPKETRANQVGSDPKAIYSGTYLVSSILSICLSIYPLTPHSSP